MGKRTIGLFGAVLGTMIGMVAGCASPAMPPSATPQPTIAAAVVEVPAPPPVESAEEPAPVDAPMIGQRVRHHVEITIDRLPKPTSLHAAATTYVLWVRGSEEEAWANAAQLAPSDDVQDAEFAYPEDVLFLHVTAEPSADARRPSSNVLLSTRVSKSGACASSVDQNHLKMRVRMCKDEK